MAPSRKLWVLSLVISGLMTSSAASADEASDRQATAHRMENSRMIVETIRGYLGQTLERIEEAKEERDVAKVVFLNEKTTALKGLMRIAEQADINLQEDLLKHDEKAAAHEEQKLAIALQKAVELLAEASSYVGEVEIYAGDTKVEMVVTHQDGQTTSIVNFASLFPIVIGSPRPPAASPYE